MRKLAGLVVAAWQPGHQTALLPCQAHGRARLARAGGPRPADAGGKSLEDGMWAARGGRHPTVDIPVESPQAAVAPRCRGAEVLARHPRGGDRST